MSITVVEIIVLLAVFWLPPFILASLVQWILLRKHREAPQVSKRIGLLFVFLIAKIVLSFLILISPLQNYFLDLHRIPFFEIGGDIFQAGVLAAILVTVLVYVGSKYYGKRSIGNAL